MDEWQKEEEEEDRVAGSGAAFVAGFGEEVVENWEAIQGVNCHHLHQKFEATLVEGRHRAVS
jgi:hypothetical protein